MSIKITKKTTRIVSNEELPRLSAGQIMLEHPDGGIIICAAEDEDIFYEEGWTEIARAEAAYAQRQIMGL